MKACLVALGPVGGPMSSFLLLLGRTGVCRLPHIKVFFVERASLGRASASAERRGGGGGDRRVGDVLPGFR